MKTISHAEFLKLKERELNKIRTKQGQFNKINKQAMTHDGVAGKGRTKGLNYSIQAAAGRGELRTERTYSNGEHIQTMRRAKTQKITTTNFR